MVHLEFDQEEAALGGEPNDLSQSPTQEEQDEEDCQLDSPAYMTNDFRVNSFKVVPCSKRFSHDWTTCPFAHPGEKARRRDPKQCKYAAIACIDMKNTNFCPRGEDCPYAHNVFEYWMHPTRYRTQMCNDGINCRRKICFFAHRRDELRVPPHKPGFPPEWQKGKKHSRSRSSGSSSARSPKQTTSPKSPVSARTPLASARSLSGPVDIKKPLEPTSPQELFKSKSFTSGQFSVPDAYMRRSMAVMAFNGAGLPMHEAWDFDGQVPPGNPPVHIPAAGTPWISPQQISPQQQRRSFDVAHCGQTEPTIPENGVPFMTAARQTSEADVARLIEQLMRGAGYAPETTPFCFAPTDENYQSLMGCLSGSDELVRRASMDSQPGQGPVLSGSNSGVSLGVPETATGIPEYGSQRVLQDYAPYPMMGSHPDLVNSMGMMSINDNNLQPGEVPATGYMLSQDSGDAGLYMAY